jgi:hypothetical protein
MRPWYRDGRRPAGSTPSACSSRCTTRPIVDCARPLR